MRLCVGKPNALRGHPRAAAASAWIFRAGAIERKSAVLPAAEWEEQDTLEPESYYQELREVFSRNLPRYFNGQERIGMSLTGGLDTRMIMAWQKPAAGSLPCYTFGGTFRDCQDVHHRAASGRVCGQSHEVIRAGDEFLSRFPHYAERDGVPYRRMRRCKPLACSLRRMRRPARLLRCG